MPYMLPMFIPMCDPKEQTTKTVMKELRARCRRYIEMQDTRFRPEINTKRYELRVDSLLLEMERWGFIMPQLDKVRSYLISMYPNSIKTN